MPKASAKTKEADVELSNKSKPLDRSKLKTFLSKLELSSQELEMWTYLGYYVSPTITNTKTVRGYYGNVKRKTETCILVINNGKKTNLPIDIGRYMRRLAFERFRKMMGAIVDVTDVSEAIIGQNIIESVKSRAEYED